MIFNVNGKCQVSFDPDDTEFAEGVFTALVDLDKMHTRYRDEINRCDKAQVYDIAKRVDAEMRNCVDSAVKYPICAAIVEDAARLMHLAGGNPIWFNIICGFVEKINAPTPWCCQEVVNKYLKRKCGDGQ